MGSRVCRMRGASCHHSSISELKYVSIRTRTSDIKNALWLVIPALLISAAVWFDWLPWLRGNSEWQWPLRSIDATARWLIPIVTLGLYVLIGTRWLRGFERDAVPRHYARWFLIFITFAAPIIQFALAASVSGHPLLEFFGPTVSVHNSGYFTTAVATPDLNQLLAHYSATMPQLPIHAQSHPPGPVVAQWLSWKFFQAVGPAADIIALPLRTLQCHNPGLMSLDNAQIASASLGMLLPFIGGLAVWPLFALGRRLTTARAAALTTLLFPILPLFALWPAQWDQIYPLLLLSGLYLMHTGLEHRSMWRIFLSGVPLSIASFFSVGNFVLMVIVGAYGALWLLLNRRLDWAIQTAIGLGLGCVSIWLAYALIYGVNPLDVISTGSRLAFESTTGNRSYGTWLLGNPIDFAMFLGTPLVIILLARFMIRPRRPVSLASKSFFALSVATFGTLGGLWLSGIVRGEVGRLWLYFGPLLALIAARIFPRHSSLVVALLALQLFVMNTRWLINDSFLDEPPERVANYQVPSPMYGARYSFGQQIGLIGYDVQATASQIDLTLDWAALVQPPHAYTVFAHVVDATGQSVGQQDNMPLHDQLPTSCWRPGEYISDPYTIKIAENARGPFSIEVGLYRLETGERLPLDDGSGSSVRLIVP